MDVMVIILALCVAVFLFNAIQLLFQRQDETGLKKRLKTISTQSVVGNVRNDVLKEKKKKSNNTIGLSLVSKKLDDELTAAGIKVSGDEFLRMWLIVIFGPAFLLLLFGVSFISILALVIIGITIPPLIVANAKKKKAQLFNKQLGEALLVMSNSLRAGYSFQQAMDSIAKEMQPPISEEFRICLREMDMGIPMNDALVHMVERTQNEDVKILVSAVLISSQVGANLADVLQSISGTIQDRINMRDQVRVLTAQGRLSGMIVGGIPIFLFLFLMITNPSYISSFIGSPIGLLLLLAGGILEVFGFLVINAMVNIKY